MEFQIRMSKKTSQFWIKVKMRRKVEMSQMNRKKKKLEIIHNGMEEDRIIHHHCMKIQIMLNNRISPCKMVIKTCKMDIRMAIITVNIWEIT